MSTMPVPTCLHGEERISTYFFVFFFVIFSQKSLLWILVKSASSNEYHNILCFQHLSESRFLLHDLHRRSTFANFCYDLMQNHLS